MLIVRDSERMRGGRNEEDQSEVYILAKALACPDRVDGPGDADRIKTCVSSTRGERDDGERDYSETLPHARHHPVALHTRVSRDLFHHHWPPGSFLHFPLMVSFAGRSGLNLNSR